MPFVRPLFGFSCQTDHRSVHVARATNSQTDQRGSDVIRESGPSHLPNEFNDHHSIENPYKHLDRAASVDKSGGWSNPVHQTRQDEQMATLDPHQTSAPKSNADSISSTIAPEDPTHHSTPIEQQPDFNETNQLFTPSTSAPGSPREETHSLPELTSVSNATEQQCLAKHNKCNDLEAQTKSHLSSESMQPSSSLGPVNRKGKTHGLAASGPTPRKRRTYGTNTTRGKDKGKSKGKDVLKECLEFKQRLRQRNTLQQQQLTHEQIEEILQVEDNDQHSDKTPDRGRQSLKLAGCGVFQKDGKMYVSQGWACKSSIWKHLPSCRRCTQSRSGPTCMFIDLRAFPAVIEGDKVFLADNASTEYILQDRQAVHRPLFPTHNDLNKPMDDDYKRTLMLSCAKRLVGLMDCAVLHTRQPNVIHRKADVEYRDTCDFCFTGLFASSYICFRCGQEYCIDCYSDILRLSGNAETKQESHILRCYVNSVQHTRNDLRPVTRFSQRELEDESSAMHQLLQLQNPVRSSADSVAMSNDEDTVGYRAQAKLTNGVPSHAIVIHRREEMKEELFLRTWGQGKPVLVEGIHFPTMWTAKVLQQQYGSTACKIVRCDDFQSLDDDEQIFEKETTVQEFFQSFGQSYEVREQLLGKGNWKLKDWPSSSNFKDDLTGIYDDFNACVPMPDFTRRDGCKNVSSLFATNAVVPDLGPKMYNAWAGTHVAGGHGTTKLHMDVADAVNILLDVNIVQRQDESEAGALWHIFRAEDALAIRDFLRQRCSAGNKGDPIHSQQYYLDDELLKELYEQKGIYAWRFIQRRGQAIFIPAGCAHQVCNLCDCIKIAVDFLSLQNLDRCAMITNEFRSLSGADRKSWKEDMLQLHMQLWYAWCACRQLLPPPLNEHNSKKRARLT